MNALVATSNVGASGPLLRTLVLCDLVDSTALVERLGDQRAATLLRRHDRLARDLLLLHGGQEIDKTDGFLVMFERPIQGVAFALDYQRQLRELGKDENVVLRARVGLHVGDVVVWENSPADVANGAKPMEVEGLVKPVAARLASLALPGQILASGVAASLAQRAHVELVDRADAARWINHGRYRFKGVPEPVPVYEIGEAPIAPLTAPPWSSKAHREVPWWRRPATVVLEALLVVVCIGASAWWVLRSPPAIAFAQRDWVVVGSFNNLTREDRFDDSLQTAFRIGLEQSRYVNVLSELQVRDTLRRMQREVTTPIDRSIGSEIALREGAKALILPMVSEVGGKLRINAEVIDPKTQATVFIDTAEGDGGESALTSLDLVGQSVRAKLGESLAAINSSAAPLPKVTSSNLDALRAYALGAKAFLDVHYSEALSLFDQALTLDPGFASAHVGKARTYLSSGDRINTLKELTAAAPLRERLPPREALYFDALLATFHSVPEMLEKWKVLGTLYPDLYYAHTNYALFSWQHANDIDSAIEELQLSLNPHNASLGASHYLLATLYLAKDRVGDARAEMRTASELGRPQGLVSVELAAAQRDFAEARRIDRSLSASGLASDDIFHFVPKISLAADNGLFAEADEQLQAAAAASHQAGDLYRRLFAGIDLSLQSLRVAPMSTKSDLKAFVTAEMAAAQREDDPDANHAAFASAFGVYLMAKMGEGKDAAAFLPRIESASKRLRFPVVDKMLDVARAQIALSDGKANQAITLLTKKVDGTELFLSHDVLTRALIDDKKWTEAAKEAEWLATHRGRAYAEFGSLYLQRPYNVAISDIAQLQLAEIAFAEGNRGRSRSALNAFEKSWPAQNLPEPYTSRVASLRRDLDRNDAAAPSP